jgi:hypothetical protein
VEVNPHLQDWNFRPTKSLTIDGAEGAAESEITGVHGPLLLVALNRLLSEPERFPIDASPRRDGPKDNAAVDVSTRAASQIFIMRTSAVLS